ncbi:MAG: hypothetical protein K2F79_03830, partial [Muribaculaceae bacterium]|nr:hypothetical protein [Muribaculaceae bacterium]
GLECELREYVIFEGSKRDFRSGGGKIKDESRPDRKKERRPARPASRDSRDSLPARGNDQRRQRPADRRDAAAPAGERRRPARPSAEEAGAEKNSRRPLDLKRLGRTPSISADKEIIINRPSWRKRRKDQENDQ